jgi:predicted RNase H-like HicB family nuclease
MSKDLLLLGLVPSICPLESSFAGSRNLDLPYRIILTQERRKGSSAWLSLVEELPGCEARGDTPEEATRALRDEIAAWIDNAFDRGEQLPLPRFQPSAPDGRLSLRIPQSLHEALAHAAVREGLSVDELVTVALASMLRWGPGESEASARWIQSRAESIVGDDEPPRGLRRAILLNVGLLVLVAVVAVGALIAVIVHGL